jgi:hypothetical protein
MKIIILRIMCVLLFIIITYSSVSHAAKPYYARLYTKATQGEPQFYQVLEAHLKHKNLSLREIQKLKKRLRASAYLPTLYLGYDHSFKEQEGLDINDNISVSSGGVLIGPEDNDYNYDTNFGQTIRVRAVWKLGDILYNRNHLLLEQERRSMIKFQDDHAKDLYKIYEERHLYLMRYLQARNGGQKRSSMYYAKFKTLTEKLDAMTGGVFRERWGRGK